MGSVEIILKSSFYLPFSGAQFQILKPSQNLTAAGLLGWDAGELGGGVSGSRRFERTIILQIQRSVWGTPVSQLKATRYLETSTATYLLPKHHVAIEPL